MSKLNYLSIGLLLLLIIKQLAWVGFMPLWQFPDEQAHFAQVQNLVEERTRSINPLATTSREIYETEVLLGTERNDLGNNKYTYHPEFNIEYTDSTVGKFESTILNFPEQYRHDRVIREATGYPPLYYQLSSLGYRLAYQQDFLTRVFTTRLINIFLFIVFYLVVFSIGRELFNKKNIALLFTLLIVFQPMLSFVMAGVNSDNLFNLLFAISILLSLRLLNRGWHLSTLLLALVNLFLIMKTKPHGILVAVIYLYPLFYLLVRRSGMRIKHLLIISLILLAGFGGVIFSIAQGAQFIPEIGRLKEFPQLSTSEFITHLKNTVRLSYRLILPWYWGVFRWLSMTYPRLIHRMINGVILFAVVGIIVAIYRNVKNPAKNILKPELFLFLFYVSGVYFLALTVFDYLFIKSYGFSFGFQGRYFFPVISAHMGLLLMGIKTLFSTFKIPGRFMKWLGIAMIGLHIYAHYLVSVSYYAAPTLRQAFRFASQYKPALFKSPYLEVASVFLLLLYGLFIYKYLQVFNEKEN